MCGVAGFFYRDVSRLAEGSVLDRMTDIMVHRGPDDRGTFLHPGGGLGHRRLSILDLSPGGRQPMASGCARSVITFNGEIYNYRELAGQYLSGFALRTGTDTEVLLELMARRGSDSIPLLNGMFAFAYWDLAGRKVVFARDPAGQKPFFYYMSSDTFVFGSELSAVAMHPEVPLELDRRALAKYLSFEGYPHPTSGLKGVRKLPPGYYMVLDLVRWTLTEVRYWRSVPEPVPHPPTLADAVEDFDARLKRSIERHYRSDVPVGIFLSAGLDSSAIVRAAVELKGPEAIETFTIRHADKSFDEADEAKETADFFGVRHRERLITEREMGDNVQRLLDGLDEPLADPGFISISQVIRFASEYVTVTLGGDGGDEYFAGYAPFRALAAYRWINPVLPGRLAQALGYLASLPKADHAYMNPAFKVQRFLRGVTAKPPELLMRWFGAFSPEEIALILNDPTAPASVYGDLLAEVERLRHPDVTTVMLHQFQQFYLPTAICAHSDKASMMLSQELRSPLLDTELIAFANALPARFKIHRDQTKVLMREYHRRDSPPGVANRGKRGFTVPIARWLTSTLRSWAAELLAPDALQGSGVFDVDYVQRLWHEHQALRANHAKALWTILVFQNWYYQTFSKWKSMR
jgi:asparagine synthase (glutamine-hydrolysing)